VSEYISDIGQPDIIVSGGASGVDTMAEKYALDNEYDLLVFKPDWNKYGKTAGPLRNTQIVEYATHVIAFVSEKSVGTYDTINKAKNNQKMCKIIDIDNLF
jgi:hypothetical protein